jgi:DNA-binding transcriptional LysR family regulator
MVRFTLQQLRYFRAVADHGGIAQAARILHIAQPSVAQAVAKLEAQTGLTLFERHHARGVSLTAPGRHFLAEAVALLDHAEQAGRVAAALAREDSGELRLGCFLTIAAFYLPALVHGFRDSHPAIRIEPRELTLDAIAAGLSAGDLDMALTYDIGRLPAGCGAAGMLTIEPKVILPATHRLARRATVTAADLADQPYVLFEAPGSTEYFTLLLNKAGLSPRIGYSATSIEGVRSAVANGFGFSIVALRPDGPRSYDGKRIKTIALAGKTDPLHIVLASRPGFAGSTLAKRFTSQCRSYFDALRKGA